MTGKRDAPDAEALATRLLARREHSRAELAGKLSRRGLDEIEIGPALDRLEESGALSQARFVAQLVRTRLRQGYGPLRIRRELAAKGVAPERADGELDLDDQAWVERAERARARHFGASLPTGYADRARQARYLERRGYTAAHAGRVLGSN